MKFATSCFVLYSVPYGTIVTLDLKSLNFATWTPPCNGKAEPISVILSSSNVSPAVNDVLTL